MNYIPYIASSSKYNSYKNYIESTVIVNSKSQQSMYMYIIVETQKNNFNTCT